MRQRRHPAERGEANKTWRSVSEVPSYWLTPLDGVGYSFKSTADLRGTNLGRYGRSSTAGISPSSGVCFDLDFCSAQVGLCSGITTQGASLLHVGALRS